MFIKPPRLRKHDTIGIVAPASPQRDDEKLKRGIRYFESLGYNVALGENLWKRNGYLAGTDQERADDLNAMIRNPQVRMIIAGRGGYGTTRILDNIDYASLRKNPKIIVGFSDLTALNCALLAKCKLISFSGAMPGVDFDNPDNIDAFAEEHFWRAVSSAKALGTIKQPDTHPITTLSNGVADGWLLAGNLTLLTSITGTKYLPNPSGSVLMIEEIGEESYRVDRMLAQLYNANVLPRVSALVLGAFTDTKPTRVSVDALPMSDVFEEYVRRIQKPTIQGLLYGHIKTKLTVPMGVMTRVDATRKTMRLLESGVT